MLNPEMNEISFYKDIHIQLTFPFLSIVYVVMDDARNLLSNCETDAVLRLEGG